MSNASEMSGRPFDDMIKLIQSAPDIDHATQDIMRDTLAGISQQSDPLGSFKENLLWLGGWQKRAQPVIARPLIAVFAGSHKIATAYLEGDIIAKAKARVEEMTQGPAGVRGVSAGQNMAYKVYEMGLDYPSENFLDAPSLSERDTAAAMAFGMEVVAEGADIIGFGNAGLGSATGAAAIALSLYGGAASYWADGQDARAQSRIEIVEKAHAQHRAALTSPLEILRHFGGRDIAGLVGAIIAARHQSIPIVLDGFVVSSAAAIIHAINPSAIDHCIAGHLSAEPAHAALLERLGLTPLMDFGFGRGDGLGAAMAIGVLKMGANAYQLMIDG